MGVVSELRRRNVLRMAVLYVLAAWVVMQVAGVLMDLGALPVAVGPWVLVVLVIGFPIALVFSWLFEITPEGLAREKDIPEGASITHITGRRMDFIVIAVLSAGLILFAYDKWSVPAPTEGSIAVLPFRNLSGDPEQEYFADGLADEILTVLARVPELNVAPRSATFSYKGDNLDITRVVRELGVSYLLTGSVRRAENHVRIFAELVDTDDESQLWSNTFEGQLGDVFAIQDEIALAISQHLEARLADARGNTITVSGTNKVGAHNAYLRGRFLLNERGGGNMRLAITYLQEATELDPEYAEAYAALAYAKSIGWGQTDKEGAKRNAARAIELDPSLPLAWIARAGANKLEFRYTEAEQDLREALELEPRNATAWHSLAGVIYGVRGPGEALNPALKAVTLDPSSSIYRAWLGNYYLALGEVSEGMAHLDSAMEIDVTVFEFPMLWKALTGDIQGAEAVLAIAKKEIDISDNDEAWYRAFILVADGRVDDARSLLEGREPRDSPYEADFIIVSEIYNIDEANRIMEAAFAIEFPNVEAHYLAAYMPNISLAKTRYYELLSDAGLPLTDSQISVR